MPATTIYIVDDHPSILSGLQLMLSTSSHIEVAGVFTTGTALQEGLQMLVPDVILLDIQMPGIDGIKLCRQITTTYKHAKVLAFTGCEDRHFVTSMMQNGASGYLLKTATKEELLHAIDTVLNGGQYIDAALKESLLKELVTGKRVNRYTPVLTRREKDVLKLIAAGNSNQEIANTLYLSIRTVENHRFNLMQKLEVKNAAGLVRMAIDMGVG